MIDRKKVKLIHNIVNFTNDFIGHMPEHLMQVTPMSELRFSPVSKASCLLRSHTAAHSLCQYSPVQKGTGVCDR